MKKHKLECPCCQLAGDEDLFQPDWPQRLSELIATTPGTGAEADMGDMSWQERRWFYNRLLRHGR
ncbi:MAG: hypothetical protein IIA06_07220 [Proteobacteria bacterium]|nr:hypothetical protein [Pseudomonadota bacterium]